MFVTLKEAIEAMPQDKPCAIGAFNYHNIEYAQAIIDGAEKEQSPVILMVSEMMAAYMGLDIMAAVGKIVAEKATVPVAVMLDHGKDLDLIDQAMKLGLSVMYDGSGLPFEENIAQTKAVVDKAHALGVSVEAEIGSLGQSEEGDETYEEKLTTPDQARTFVDRTGVDVLAVAVGNAHGFYVGEQKIDIDRVKAIHDKVQDVPIVMHGGSDMAVEVVKAAIESGIKKFNIATDLKYAYAKAMKEVLKDELPMAPPKIFGPVKKAVEATTIEKIRLFALK